MFTCKITVVFKVWPKYSWGPHKIPGGVWQGQSYIHKITKMLLPFIFAFTHEYTMKFIRSYMKYEIATD